MRWEEEYLGNKTGEQRGIRNTFVTAMGNAKIRFYEVWKVGLEEVMKLPERNGKLLREAKMPGDERREVEPGDRFLP